MVWPDDVPPEVAAQTRVAGGDAKTKKKKKPHLRAVEPKAAAAPAKPRTGGSLDAARAQAGEASDGKRVAVRRKGMRPADVSDSVSSSSTTRVASESHAASETSAVSESRVDAESHAPPPSSKKKLPPYLRVVK